MKKARRIRIGAWLLTFALLLSACAPVAGPAAPAEPVPTVPAPAAPAAEPVVEPVPEEAEGPFALGDKLHGFTLTEEREMESPPALLRLWVHDKTGAQAYFIHNDDPDRTFAIAFRTEPSDDTGKLHILEHAVCAASEKYPGRDVFFDAIAQAYITTINATTYKSATNYFVSSTSENQLERMADFYLDCAFHSELRNDPGYFQREGWRYTMEDADAPLTVDGIVYNEMQGVYGNIVNKHLSHGLERALFPDTYQKWDSGGDPEAIPELSYEELIAFYDSCYHPSNSVSMFYGDVETARYLKLLDEGYFSAFEAQDSAGYSPGQQPFAEPITYTHDFAVAADSSQSGSVISYAAVLPDGTDYADIAALDLGVRYIGDSASPLMEALYASGIGSDYSVELLSSGSQFYLCFLAIEADAARAEEFKKLVLAELQDMMEAGTDEEMLGSLFATEELNKALVSNQAGIGVMMASRFAQAVDSGYMELLDKSAYEEDALALCKGDGLASLLERYLFDNTHAALVVTSPKAGLQEAQAEALADSLAAKKAAMNGAEIAQLIAGTAAFNEWNDTLGSVPETLAKLRTETPENVNTALPVYNVESSALDGATLYSADVEGGAAYCSYIFDLSHLSMEELRTLKVYTSLMGYATEAYDQRALSIAMRSLLHEGNISISPESRADGSAYPALKLSFYTFDDSVAEAAALMMEMFRHTGLEANTAYFEPSITGAMQAYYSAESVAESMALAAAYAPSLPVSALSYALFGLEHYAFLNEFGKKDTAEMAEAFAAVREKALLREGAEIISIGSAAGKAARGEALAALLPQKAAPQPQGDWAEAIEKAQAQSVAFRANGTASYAAAALNVHALGLAPTGDLILLLSVMDDTFLLPEFRFQMGAYSVGASLERTGRMNFGLFRAPSFKEFLDRLKELPGELEAVLAEMTQEELAGYQLSYLSSATQPFGPWAEALDQIDNQRHGVTSEERQALLDEVRAATPESLAAALPDLKKCIDAAGTSVVAPGAAVDAEKARFESVVTLP